MMRRLSYGLLVLSALLLCACHKEGDTVMAGQVIELVLRTSDDMETKDGANGVMEGVDRYNENLISWVDFFFYPGGATDADATYHVRRESGTRRSDVMRREMTSEQVNSIIFPSAPEDTRSCTVFAVVNYPGTLVADEADLSGTSLPELEALEVSTDFVSPSNHRQTRFMMSGKVNLTLRGRAQVVAAAGQIDLRRYACKLTVGVDVLQDVMVGNEVWHPMLTGMEIYLVNGVSNVLLSGNPDDDALEPDYFSYRNNAMQFAYMDLQDQIHFYFEKEGSYYQTYPTYMYPQRWVYGSTESPDKEPFLKLVVPWQRDADPEHGILATQRQFYYKVMIPDDRREEFRRSFVRNNWYHIDIRVGILGSETDEASVLINPGWVYIYYWQDKEVVIKNAEIGNARYLSVEHEHYDLHNIDESPLRYTSSHPVMMQDIRVTRPYYGEQAAGQPAYGATITAAGNNDPDYPKGTLYLNYSEDQRKELNGGEDWFTDSGQAIVFHHVLQNNYADKNKMFDYSPYQISYTLVHKDRPDDDAYKKTVTVTQYPGIYIERTVNTDRMITIKDPTMLDPEGNPKNHSVPEHWGYVYIDNEQYTKAQYNIDSNKDTDTGWRFDHLWRVVYYSSGGRDMYRINVTVLPEDSDFVIGDPRQATVDNLRDASDFFHDGPDLNGNTRSLQHYYPTENSARTVDMIAPAYRISTKLSGIEWNGITYQKAKERCAAFQENGFPAGRWRLPTKGEVRFISQLSGYGYFEWQFGGDYWSANGAVNVNKNTGAVTDSNKNLTSDIAFLRCVYDSWYWGDEQVSDLEQFTWADAER